MKKYALLMVLGLSTMLNWACTTAVISGKYTPNGRPMLWKLRDSDFPKNKMMYFTDGKYEYIGLVNTSDIEGENVWGGSNSVGFAIMNSASFNVNLNDSAKVENQEGKFMKKALQQCASLADFEALLEATPKPWGLAAHFGVIDAEGGAAFFEVNNYTYTRFDANDTQTAPQGYILRTNFSFTGKKDTGYGFIRFQTAEQLFAEADATNNITAQTIMQDFSRCFKHSLLKQDFRAIYEQKTDANYFVNSGDFITRHGSSSCIVIEGVKANEAKDMATIWVQVAYPNTCVSLPLWVRGGAQMPAVLMANQDKEVPLSNWSLALKNKCYPVQRSSGFKYLCISKLFNAQHTGYLQQIEPFENTIFSETEQHLQTWRKQPPSANEIQTFYRYLDKEVSRLYTENMK